MSLSTAARGIVQQASQLATEKELEWQQANRQRLDALQQALKEAEEAAEKERIRFAQLQEDFKYNLRVLRERDEELERYDSVFAQMSAHLSGKDAESSQLCISVDTLKQELAASKLEQEELRRDVRTRLQLARQDLDALRVEKENVIKKERAQFEKFKREYHLSLCRLEEDASQRERELTSAFEEALARREHELRLQHDEQCASLHSEELHVRSLSSELQSSQRALQKCEAACAQLEETNKSLEKQVRDITWQLADNKTISEAKISDLSSDVVSLRQENETLRRTSEECRRQYQVTLQERDKSLVAIRETHGEECCGYQKTIAELRADLEKSQSECRRLQWSCEETGRQRAEDVTRLQRELVDVKGQLEQQSSTVSQDKVARDVECRTLREQMKLARAAKDEHDKELEKYKSELKSALDRMVAMQRSHDGEHLEWQRRLEVSEQQQHQRNEGIVESLMKARDEMSALAEQRLSELTQRDRVLRLLQADRAQALRVLKENGLEMPSTDATVLALSEEAQNMAELRAQNDNLRSAIRMMREEMEGVGHQQNASVATDSATARSDYTVALEKELAEVKRTNRQLKITMEESRTTAATSRAEASAQAEAVRHCSHDMSRLRAQLDESRHTIDRLLHDKSESVASLRQEQLKSSHLRQVLSRIEQKAGKHGAGGLLQSAHSLALSADLESKLKAAQWRITQLSSERDKLVQLSNKQRATIRRLEASPNADKDKPSPGPARATPVGSYCSDAGAVSTADHPLGRASDQPLNVHFDAHQIPSSTRQLGEHLRHRISTLSDFRLNDGDQGAGYGRRHASQPPARSSLPRTSTSRANEATQPTRIPVASTNRPSPPTRRSTGTSGSKVGKQSPRVVPASRNPGGATPRNLLDNHGSRPSYSSHVHHSDGISDDTQFDSMSGPLLDIRNHGNDQSPLSSGGQESTESMKKVWSLLDHGLSELDSATSAQ